MREVPVPTELLRASQAARELEISTRDLLPLVYDRRVCFVMVDGIGHVPPDALDEYRAQILLSRRITALSRPLSIWYSLPV